MNFTNITFYEHEEDLLDVKAPIVLSVVAVLGILLNLWQLCAIVTSADIRSRMRNKLIVSTCVLHLTECCLKIPLCLFVLFQRLNFPCLVLYSYFNIVLILDFVCNWILVEMIVLYLCQIMDLKLSQSLSISSPRIVTISVLLSPWVASLITVPAIYMLYNSGESACFFPYSFQVFKSIDSIVPLLLSIIVLVVAIIKKRNRYRKGFSASNMQVELISRGPELDETSAYVVGLAISILCDIGLILEDFQIVEYSSISNMLLTTILENSRVIFMVLPWLLFKDIRTRMKTWGPWYRPSPYADLALTYRKSEKEP